MSDVASESTPADLPVCHCGEPVYDVLDSIRTCGHLDEEAHYDEEDHCGY